MLSYAKLWVLLEKRGMKKTDLKKVISGNTIAKLGKNEPISSVVIEKICDFLKCQPGDIMEYISEEDIRLASMHLDEMQKQAMEILKEQGISKEQFSELLKQAANMFYENEDSMETIVDNALNLQQTSTDTHNENEE